MSIILSTCTVQPASEHRLLCWSWEQRCHKLLRPRHGCLGKKGFNFGMFFFAFYIIVLIDLISAGVLSATLTIGKHVGNFSSRWTHSNAVRSSNRPGQQLSWSWKYYKINCICLKAKSMDDANLWFVCPNYLRMTNNNNNNLRMTNRVADQ